ncbi:MAG: 3-methyl-2-oxobutanoate dehydrogenase subunit VorB [Candidatus Omnitrophica bacterium CG1_02_49_10]|nr:MAG: 3-methyl-2-oxobutanoate dehydrogenase subunit VorB [Candidatus Omnitrophica bacterium CG1_02_49_10]
MNKKILMSGNEAAGEAAILAGCTFYAGYPITPQNELTAYMAKRMNEVGGTFIQSESELAAINMVFGASVAGARAMTSSSSPGISLKQEGISYLSACELPAVIVNMVRGGPGLGNIAPAQSDYFQATRGGGHGDYRNIVLAPASVGEMLELTYKAFDLADKYRTPVIILGDGILAQMMESVELKLSRKSKFPKKSWALTGCKGRSPNMIRSLILNPRNMENLNIKLDNKYKVIKKNETRYEAIYPHTSKVVLVAYGSTSRICREVVRRAREDGHKVGMIRPITLYPFPEEVIRNAAKKSEAILTVEMSMGQMVEDVRLAAAGPCKVSFYGRSGGMVPTERAIYSQVKKLLNRKGVR